MATIRLVPSSYEISNTSITVTDASNAYTNTDSDTYARFGTTSTSSRYVYYRGFNFGDIPTGAEVSSFTIKYKANESTMSTSSSYRPRIVNNTTTLTGSSTAIGTTVTTSSFTGVSDSWATISGYGSNFGIRFTVRRSGNSGTGYLNLYGCEILVEYTVPTYYQVTASSSVTGITVDPASQSVLEGTSATVTFEVDDIDGYVVTDNGSDVTSSLVRHQHEGPSSSATFIPSSFDSTHSTYASVYNNNNPENGLTNVSSTTRCCVYANTANGSESYLYYNFDCSTIPSNAIIDSVSCQAKGSCYSSGSYFSTHEFQMCTGTTPKGTAVTVTGNGSTGSTHTVNGGTSWTRSELDSLKIRFKIVRSQTGNASFSFFGATLTVTYSLPASGYYYTYTLSNVQAAHTILLASAGPSTDVIYYKNNGSWVAATAVYKKVNGSWVLQSNLANVFSASVNYVKGN